jgi:conjugal transfer ATP-binding protein TraC
MGLITGTDSKTASPIRREAVVSTPASIQARIDLEQIDASVARFGLGQKAHFVSVLEVTGADASVASTDDATQEALMAGRAQFLNAQVEPFQVLVRAEPVDLVGHLDRISSRIDVLPSALAAIARDYVAFVQGLARQRTLLERRCYVTLPAGDCSPAASLPRQIGSLVDALRSRRAEHAAKDVDGTGVGRRLMSRCDGVSRQLGRSGLRTRRLDGHALAELYHRCWSPELARIQRFHGDLAAYTGLVVGGVPSVLREPGGPVDTGDSPATQPSTVAAAEDDERLLALGTRNLADLVAPAGFDVRPDHLQLDGHYARVLVLVAYPRTVAAGWLTPLIESDLPIEVSLHVRPLQSAHVVRALGVQIARLQSSRLAQLRGERIADPAAEIAIEDAERLRDRLQRGAERVFSVSVYVLLRGSTRRELDELTRRVEVLLDGMLAHSRRALWEQERGFRSCLPEGRDQLMAARNLDTSALAATLPLIGSSLSMERGMLYGISTRTQVPALIDPFDELLDNANMAVAAPAGAGKSFLIKIMALRNLCSGIDFVVIDPEDEYRAVANAVGGQVIRLAASSPHRLNPFDLPPASPPIPVAHVGGIGSIADEEDPLAERATALLGLFELLLGSGDLDMYERAVLDRAVYQTYAREWLDDGGARGGIRRGEAATYDRPAPLLRDLYAVLQDTPGDVATGLSARLERYVQGSLGDGMFAGPTNVALDCPFVVFHTRDLAEELRPLAIHLIAGHVWNSVRRIRRPRQLIVDEAASLLAHPEGGAFLAMMARRARKYYLGLATLSQKLQDFTDSEHGETVLQNSAMVLLLKQKADSIDAVDARFRLTAEERQLLLGADKGEGLLIVSGRRLGSLRVPLQIVASPTENRLATTNPRELERFQQLTPAANQADSAPRSISEEEAPSLSAALAARRLAAGNGQVRGGPEAGE